MVEERLDRAMVNPEWSAMFPNAKLFNLVAPVSDHSPIMVVTELTIITRRQRSFRHEPDLKSVISRCWSGFQDLSFLQRLDATGETLSI